MHFANFKVFLPLMFAMILLIFSANRLALSFLPILWSLYCFLYRYLTGGMILCGSRLSSVFFDDWCCSMSNKSTSHSECIQCINKCNNSRIFIITICRVENWFTSSIEGIDWITGLRWMITGNYKVSMVAKLTLENNYFNTRRRICSWPNYFTRGTVPDVDT